MRLILTIFFSLLFLGTSIPSFAEKNDDLKACSSDADCFLDNSCMYCNQCFGSDPFAGTGGPDCKAVCDEDNTIQCACVLNVCTKVIKEKSELLDLLKEDNDMARCQAAEALGKLANDPEVAEALTNLLDDPLEWMQSCTRSALGLDPK